MIKAYSGSVSRLTASSSMSLDAVIAIVRQKIEEVGTQKAFAEKIGISLSYLNDVLRKRREPGEKILSALGLKKEIRYKK